MVVQLELSLIALVAALAVGCTDASSVDSDWKTTDQVTASGDWRDQVIYQIMIDRFDNGDPNNDFNVEPSVPGKFHGGDWQGIIDHLDYLKSLGVTALWISPVVRNLETDANFDAYHGYWQQDFTHVNPHFGDLAKLRELVQKAHAQGFKVILDIVTNHVAQLFYYDINGNGHPDENVYGAGCGEQAPADRQPCPTGAIITHLTEYDPDFDTQGVRGYTSLGFSGLAPVRWIYNAGIDRTPTMPGAGAGQDPTRQFGFQREDWYHRKGRITDYSIREQVLTGDFPGGLKDLATERDDVRAALTAVFARWIQAADFDGFRIDTLKHVDHEFWQYFAPKIRQYAAGKITLPDPTDPSDPGKTVPPMSVPKAKFFMFGESFDGNDALNGSYTMNQEVDSTFYFSQKFTVFDGVFKSANGKTQDIADQFARKQMDYATTPNDDGIGVPATQAMVNFMDNHDVTRFLFDKPSTAALQNALSFLFTEDGIPCIYYGTEQEFNGGNDPTNRERLWDTGFRTDGATFQWIQKLIKIRKLYAPLRRGVMTIKYSTTNTGMEEDAGMIAFERADGAHKVLVVINVSDGKQSETSQAMMGGSDMLTSFAPGDKLVDILASPSDPTATFTVGLQGALKVPVAARGARILVPQADVVPLQ